MKIFILIALFALPSFSQCHIPKLRGIALNMTAKEVKKAYPRYTELSPNTVLLLPGDTSRTEWQKHLKNIFIRFDPSRKVEAIYIRYKRMNWTNAEFVRAVSAALHLNGWTCPPGLNCSEPNAQQNLLCDTFEMTAIVIDGRAELSILRRSVFKP